MPTRLVTREVFARDGWRCRYCESRVVAKEARDIFRKYLPLEARKGRTNNDNHFGLATLSASIDHVLPFRRGGTNDLTNLVTACGPCQFGKGHWTLDEVELEDPRSFPSVIDNWDGLTRLVGFKA
ncbi:HNH endonuclease [Cognatiluteimonas sedimenti]|uniref:HNH endonuclease n=1 Tax=Cognatiluteimonas sedimenti TaxID=2927791 RepID=UPI003CCD430E